MPDYAMLPDGILSKTPCAKSRTTAYESSSCMGIFIYRDAVFSMVIYYEG